MGAELSCRMLCTPMPHLADIQGCGPLTRDGHGLALAVPDAEVAQVAPKAPAGSRSLSGPLYAHPLPGERPSG
jgi:hypothetical protein